MYAVGLAQHPNRLPQSGQLRLPAWLVDLGCLSSRLGHDAGVNDRGTTLMSTAQSRGRAQMLRLGPEGIGSPVGIIIFCAGGDGTQLGQIVFKPRRFHRTSLWVPPSDHMSLVGAIRVLFHSVSNEGCGKLNVSPLLVPQCGWKSCLSWVFESYPQVLEDNEGVLESAPC